MAKKKSGVFICRRAFMCQIKGQKYSVPAHSVVPHDVGYEVLEGHEENFEQLDVEQATAAPGEKRSVSMPKPKADQPKSAKPSEEEDDQ